MERCRKRKGRLRRESATEEQKPIILIVCEGKKTEPNYFDSVRRLWRLSAMKIVGGDECGTAPKSIVNYAKNEYKKQRKDGLRKENIWCVFDRDEHETFEEALRLADDIGFGVAFSNPCFELWYLLHYKDQNRHIEREAVVRALKKHVRDYLKNKENMFELIEGNRTMATERSKNLREKHIRDGSKKTNNPSTSVDQLVEYLQSLQE